MKSSNRKSWKDKIDPAFDSMITSYVKLLDGCEELPKGYLSLNDISEPLGLEEPWWKSVIIKDSGHKKRGTYFSILVKRKKSKPAADHIWNSWNAKLFRKGRGPTGGP